MNVVIRADASSRMGTGHVMRCLVLAEALRERGAPVSFICREHPGHLVATLRARQFPVVSLPAAPASSGNDYAAWLGVSEAADAAQTLEALGAEPTDWMVVDHYGLGAAWETRVRPRVGRLLVIDDLANRPHDCALLLDQNFSAGGDLRYAALVPKGCRQLIGPRYALLARSYSQCRKPDAKRGPVKRVFVYFGGVDPADMSARVLDALTGSPCADLEVDLVIGANHAQRGALAAQAASRPGTRVHGMQPDLSGLMAGADLAIGAGGTTTWERACLGLPSLVISSAENQESACQALADAGIIKYLGRAADVSRQQIIDGIQDLRGDPSAREQLAVRGHALVDGHGASRVTMAMLRQHLHAANVTPAGFEDFSFAWIDRCREDEVLALRNAPHVTKEMRSREAIAPAEHQNFISHYGTLDRYDFVLIDNRTGRYVGAFYITNLNVSPEVGKYIGDRAYLGQGIARRAMERLLDFGWTKAGVRRFVAMTREENVRNIALNTALGFVLLGHQEIDGDRYVVMGAYR